MDLSQLKLEIQSAEQRIRALKTKAAKQKAIVKLRALRGQALQLLNETCNQYATHSMQATVRWFRYGDDDVALRLADGSTVYGSPTSDAVSKSWYGSTCCVQYTEGQTVVVEFEVHIDSDRLCLELIPRRIHGGTLDEQHYAELCKRTDLAFFKYPNGSMSGLFASKGGE